MKKQLHTFLCAVMVSIFVINLQAQEKEWLWAKAYSGSGSEITQNRIVKSSFDAEGNVYILGSFRMPAQMDGEDVHPPILGVSMSHPGQLIAKFDTNGNLIWKKVIKYDGTASPKWLQVRGDKVYALVDVVMEWSNANSHLYYLDTLVYYDSIRNIPLEECTLPFGTYRGMNAFITFDLDGNVLQQHFLQYDDRVPDPMGIFPGPWRYSLAGGVYHPFYVDSEENIYIASYVRFWGTDPSAPLYTVIDNERRDSFYMPETVPENAYSLWRWVLYKFTSDFDLLWAKPFVHRTEGIPTFESDRDDLNPRYDEIQFYGLSGDEEGNLYISGYIVTKNDSERALLCNYPIRYYWDETHYGTVHDISSALNLPFLIKFDTNGNVMWNQQLHAKSVRNAIVVGNRFNGNTVNEHSVYVTGMGQEPIGHIGDTIFMDSEMKIPLTRSNPNHETRGFYVRYDKETGNYLNHGIIPAERISREGKQPTLINNYLLMQGLYTFPVDGANKLVAYFCDDGTFLGADTIFSPSGTDISDVIVHPDGYLFTHFTGSGRTTFGDIAVQENSSRIAAFFGMMYNPSILIPYEGGIGIAEPPLPGSSLALYPNPAHTDLHLLLPADGARFERAELYSMQGQKLGEYHSCTISVAHLPAGVYIVKVYAGRESTTRKFLKAP